MDIQLSASQRAILETAAGRPNGAIYPLRPKLKGIAAERLLTVLFTNHLAVQPEGAEGPRITETGLRAIGAPVPEPAPTVATEPPAPPAMPVVAEPAPVAPTKPETKQGKLVDMLRRPEGATTEQLMVATGWQRHTVRGAISGTLRKKLGLTIVTSRPEGGGTIYRIAADG
ncbi:MAG: DUF3489 domain-containing protein [Alphaproteobacteria bacterium]|nr:DUF3489 domain-containing protein [Alphaproteobacteria bacterium]